MLMLLAATCLLPAQSDAAAVEVPFNASAAADGVIEAITPMIANPKKPFRMLVTFEVKADREEEFLDLVASATRKTRQESGNITYHLGKVVNPDAENGDNPTYILFETWKSLDALDSHLRTDYLADMLEKLGEYTVSTELQILEANFMKEHRRVKAGQAMQEKGRRE